MTNKYIGGVLWIVAAASALCAVVFLYFLQRTARGSFVKEWAGYLHYHILCDITLLEIVPFWRKYMNVSIAEQIERLLSVPAFKSLDATWVRTRGTAWFEQLRYPNWMEGPLVQVKRNALGSYCKTLQAAIDAVPGIKPTQKRVLELAKWQLWKSYYGRFFDPYEHSQPGDFVIVPAQHTDRYKNQGAMQFDQTRHDTPFGIDSEHGLTALAEACYLIIHAQGRRSGVVCCIDDRVDNAVNHKYETNTTYFIHTGDSVELTVNDRKTVFVGQYIPTMFIVQ